MGTEVTVFDGLLVDGDGGEQVVDARTLHAALGIKTQFSDWVVRNFDGYVEGEEYYSKMSNITDRTVGKPRQDYNLSRNMAKHLAQLAKTPEGKRVRQYLIDAEVTLRKGGVKMVSIEEQLASAVLLAKDVIDGQKARIATLECKNDLLAKVVENVREAVKTDIVPKLEYYKRAVETHQNYEVKVSEAAKLIGLPFSNVTLNEHLRSWGWMFAKSTEPTQEAIERGYMVVKESVATKPDKYGVFHSSIVPYITLKGRIAITERFIEKGVLNETQAVKMTLEHLRLLIKEQAMANIEGKGVV